MKLRPFFLIILSVTFISLLSAQDFKKEYHEKFVIKSGMKLFLRSGDGDVKITPSNTDEVKVDIVYHADHRGATDSDRTFEVEFDQTSKVLHIIGRERFGSRYGISSRRVYQYTYDIKAPAYMTLDLEGDDGNMEISGWKNNIEIAISDGDLILKDIDCEETSLQIDDGNLTIEKIKSDLSIWMDDGDAEITNISAVNCQLDLKDGSCRMQEVSGKYKIRFDDGDVKMRAVEADILDIRGKDGRIELELTKSVNPDITLVSDDGPVRLHLNAATSAELSIETDDGDFSINLSNENRVKEGKRWYQSTINEGKGIISIRTNDGSVRVREI